MKLFKNLNTVWFVIAVALPGCGGGGGGSSSSPEEPSIPPIEATSAFACGSGGATITDDGSPGSYVLFESAPVRPLALSADGTRLLVTNTPANCLEIYAIEADQFRLQATVMVGMEPVAVAFANDREAWVVNHLSDSVSVVDLSGPPRVVRTLQV